MLPAPLTHLTGRGAEVVEIVRLLDAPDCRLLTIAGPAGIGKTRLAVEVARKLASQVPYAIRFVALADLHVPEAIVPALAEAVGCHFYAGVLSSKQQLLDHLCRQEYLLVLDNFEHLLPDGADLIQELLQRCPGLRMLVTSRERLQLSCEAVYVLDGLDYPSDTPTGAPDSYSAVKLFVETAQRARRRFVLDAGSEQDVVEICRLVDGVPLAIVLAAAWAKVLTPAQIAAELRQGPEFLEADLARPARPPTQHQVGCGAVVASPHRGRARRIYASHCVSRRVYIGLRRSVSPALHCPRSAHWSVSRWCGAGPTNATRFMNSCAITPKSNWKLPDRPRLPALRTAPIMQTFLEQCAAESYEWPLARRNAGVGS